MMLRSTLHNIVPGRRGAREGKVSIAPAGLLQILLAIIFFAVPSSARESACYLSAESWIKKLPGDHSILQAHAQTNCDFAGKFIGRYPGKTQAARERLCYDLVLIWTHKKCIYFRDDVSPAAYSPCKSWSREMFQHCLDRDDEWFLAGREE